jgi:uncharacterized membrane protein
MDIKEKLKEKTLEIVTTFVVSLLSLLLLGAYSLIDEKYTNTAAKKALWALLLLLLITIILLSSYVVRLRKQLNSNTRRNAGTIQGHVSDSLSGNSIQGALITAQNEQTKNEYQTASNEEGLIKLRVPAGDYSVTIAHEQYISVKGFCEVRDGFGHISFGFLQKKPESKQPQVIVG